MFRVLIIDDDGEAVLSLTRALQAKVNDVTAFGVGSISRAQEHAASFDPHVAIVDLSLEPKRGVESGFECIQFLKQHVPHCKLIVLTGHSSTENGIKALQLGASHFLEKPPHLDHLAALVLDAGAQSNMLRTYSALKNDSPVESLSSELLGESDKAAALRKKILIAASSPLPVLLTGETGTGKTLCASLIHSLSDRKKASFICYTPNYGTPDLVASDLFGHLKGSFTGALESRKGLLEECHRGTLFLDEVDELPMETQVSLLRFLQAGAFRPTGSNKEMVTDVRLVAATNRTLVEIREKNKLREDFLQRIAHLVIEVPALRERLNDIPLLAQSVISKLRRTHPISVQGMESDALAALQRHDWPGNIRELEGCVQRAVYNAQFNSRTFIHEEDLELQSKGARSDVSGANGFHAAVEAFKFSLVESALKDANGNQVHAAKRLGLDRSSLRRILNR